MSKIEFISHERFPEDEYTKELIYLCLESKYRVAYIRKAAKNGGLFWSVASVGITKNGAKQYFPAFIQDSNFLEKDIKDYLESRAWEKNHSTDSHRYASVNQSNDVVYPSYMTESQKPRSMDEVQTNNDLPF